MSAGKMVGDQHVISEQSKLAQADDGTQVHINDAPLVYISSIQLALAGNDFMAILSHPRPALDIGKGEQGALLETSVVLQMSAQTLKDFVVLGQSVVASYEAEWGEIKTPYTQRKQAKVQ